jgi:hypothetical protein
LPEASLTEITRTGVKDSFPSSSVYRNGMSRKSPCRCRWKTVSMVSVMRREESSLTSMSDRNDAIEKNSARASAGRSGGVQPEVLRFPEAEQGGDQVGGERLRRGVVVPDDRVIVPAGVLDAVLDLYELLLESEVPFAGLELRILFRNGEKR